MSAPPECIFCKIISGAIPCHQLYRTSNCLAFFDINPLSTNHFLVIPTKHAEHLHDCTEGFWGDALGVGAKVMRALYGEGKVPAYNVLQNNGKLAHQDVMHVHVHFIPKTSQDDGLGMKWVSKTVSHAELGEMAKKVRTALHQED